MGERMHRLVAKVCAVLAAAPAPASAIDSPSSPPATATRAGAPASPMPQSADRQNVSGTIPLYGAFAYDNEGGANGWSANYETAEEAERNALRECGVLSSNCKHIATFDSACGAFADTREPGGPYAWSIADTLDEALRRALDACNKKAGRAGGECGITMWACSGVDAD